MALEGVIFQQDPFIYGCKDYIYNMDAGYNGFGMGLQPPPLEEEKKPNSLHNLINEEEGFNNRHWESPPSSAAHTTISSPDTACGFFSSHSQSPPPKPRKRRRAKPTKNQEEMESQRMTHIAVERNRRRQMNDYLAVLRSLMPPSYAQRGDQASIVGGAINFVKELEQLHQFLEANSPANLQQLNDTPFSNFFAFPQYSTCPRNSISDTAAERRSSIADIEVMMVESHANIKLSTKRRPRQLLKLVAGFQSIGLTILHLNVTTVHHSVLYSFSVKVEEECEMSTVNDVATSVHGIVGMIEEDRVNQVICR